MSMSRSKPITLGDFRKYTEHLSDDIEIYYASQVAGQAPICTMEALGDNELLLATRNYGERDIMGIVRAMTFLKKK